MTAPVLGTAVLLTAIAVYDARTHIIPGKLLLCMAVIDAVNAVHTGTLVTMLAGVLACGLPVLIFSLLVGHGKAIGGGDVKLCAALGGLLGPQDGAMTILTALVLLSVWGLLTATKKRPIPFGPFALLAYLTVMFAARI